MRIGIDISALTVPRTGVGNYSLSLLETLLSRDKKNEYILFAFVFRGESNILNSPLVKFPNVSLKLYRVHRGVLRRLWHFIPFFSADLFYKGIDFLHMSDIFYLPTKKVPTIATIYDMTPSLFPSYHYKRNIQFHYRRNRYIAKNSKLVITLSESSKKDIYQILKIPSKQIRIVPGGVSKDYRRIKNNMTVKKLLNKYELKKNEYFLFIGTLEPRKNIETILEAFSQTGLQKKGFKVVLVGQRGWGYKSIVERINNLNLNDSTIITDYIPKNDVVLLMNGAQSFVYPSYYEGFGLPVLEAMACGIPVITSNSSSLPEVVGDCGIMTNPSDYKQLAFHMLELVNKPKLHARLSEKSLKRAKIFTWENSAEKLLDIYEEMGRKL